MIQAEFTGGDGQDHEMGIPEMLPAVRDAGWARSTMLSTTQHQVVPTVTSEIRKRLLNTSWQSQTEH